MTVSAWTLRPVSVSDGHYVDRGLLVLVAVIVWTLRPVSDGHRVDRGLISLGTMTRCGEQNCFVIWV